MLMTTRHEYSLDLADFNQQLGAASTSQWQLRAPQTSDTNAIAELMLEAYRGTIDYEGETLDGAIAEVKTYLAGERWGRPLMDVSRLAFDGERLAGACLAAEWHGRQTALISYVVTHGEWKRRGVGRQVLRAVLTALRAQDHQQVRAVITEGNVASEQLFGRMGFQRVDCTPTKKT
jgi:L-amino acid N-acyltransferase YncA